MEESKKILEIKNDMESDIDVCGGNSITENNNCSCKKKKKKCIKCNSDTKTQNNKDNNEKGKICSKCGQNKAQIKFRNDPCCQECCIQAIEHKVKYTLRTLINLKKNELFLLAYSGGPNSLALLKIISECLFNSGAKKMFFRVKIIHIDESTIYGYDKEKRQENIIKIADACKELGFDHEILSLEEIFELKNFDKEKIFPLISEEEKKACNSKNVEELVNNLSDSGSSKEFLLQSLKTTLLISYAKHKKIEKIIFGDSGQNVACKILSDIIQGRGIDVETKIKYLDDMYKTEGVLIGRPMRDFLKKEIAYHNHVRKLDHFLLENPKLCELVKENQKLPGKGNFNFLIDDLFDRLQENNNATIHTVLNTCEKVKKRSADNQNLSCCPLCKNSKDKMNNLLEIGSLPKNQKVDDLEKNIYANYIEDPFLTKNQIKSRILCFGCQRIFENSKNKELFFDRLPFFIKEEIEEKGLEVEKNNINEKIATLFISKNN